MTTNSFGTSPIPKFGYEPVFSNAVRSGGLPMGAKVAAAAAATGLAYYSTSSSGSSHDQKAQPSASYAAASDAFRNTVGERQFLPNRLSNTMKKRQKSAPGV